MATKTRDAVTGLSAQTDGDLTPLPTTIGPDFAGTGGGSTAPLIAGVAIGLVIFDGVVLFRGRETCRAPPP